MVILLGAEDEISFRITFSGTVFELAANVVAGMAVSSMASVNSMRSKCLNFFFKMYHSLHVYCLVHGIRRMKQVTLSHTPLPYFTYLKIMIHSSFCCVLELDALNIKAEFLFVTLNDALLFTISDF